MKHMVVVLTEPTEGKEDEFNEYYEGLHIDEVLQSTGWKSAQRFKLTEQAGLPAPHRYLALYEVEAEPGESVLQKLNETRSQRQQSDALNRETAAVWIFAETGSLHE